MKENATQKVWNPYNWFSWQTTQRLLLRQINRGGGDKRWIPVGQLRNRMNFLDQSKHDLRYRYELTVSWQKDRRCFDFYYRFMHDHSIIQIDPPKLVCSTRRTSCWGSNHRTQKGASTKQRTQKFDSTVLLGDTIFFRNVFERPFEAIIPEGRSFASYTVHDNPF